MRILSRCGGVEDSDESYEVLMDQPHDTCLSHSYIVYKDKNK